MIYLSQFGESIFGHFRRHLCESPLNSPKEIKSWDPRAVVGSWERVSDNDNHQLALAINGYLTTELDAWNEPKIVISTKGKEKLQEWCNASAESLLKRMDDNIFTEIMSLDSEHRKIYKFLGLLTINNQFTNKGEELIEKFAKSRHGENFSFFLSRSRQAKGDQFLKNIIKFTPSDEWSQIIPSLYDKKLVPTIKNFLAELETTEDYQNYQERLRLRRLEEASKAENNNEPITQ